MIRGQIGAPRTSFRTVKLISWRGGFQILVLVAALVAMAQLALAAGGDDSLIAGAQPVRSSGVHRPERLTDGEVATRGDFWKTDRTSVFRSPDAFVVYDLGQDRTIHAAYLMGDNNDTYTLSVSKDDVHYDTLWESSPVGGRGLQPRLNDRLDGTGRYLRVTARGGGFPSVGWRLLTR